MALPKLFKENGLMLPAIDITQLLDARNIDLWRAIHSKYQVNFQISPNSAYGCYTQLSKVTFFIPHDNYCTSSFTHELLHIYLYLNGIYIDSNLMLHISEGKLLPEVFTRELLEHIGNCLNHIKMFPIYLQMGFPREKFLLDYHVHKCTDRKLSDIRSHYKQDNHSYSQAEEVFIAKFFAIKTDPNDVFNYQSCLL